MGLEVKTKEDAVTYYNANKKSTAIRIMVGRGKFRKNGKGYVNDAGGRFWVTDNGCVVTEGQGTLLQNGVEHTPFMVYANLKFGGDTLRAYQAVHAEMVGTGNIGYVRVGINYYKVVNARNRFGLFQKELIKWSKQTLVDDAGKGVLEFIPKYDKFIMHPDNLTYEAVVDGNYNMYNEFQHKEKKGKWPHTEYMLRQVFGKQYEMGLIYMQVLYLLPKQALPILVLTSKERRTGKTTFLNWLSAVFGENKVNVTPHNLANNFNAAFADKNIIAIEEAVVSERKNVIEKLKDYATAKKILMERKGVDATQIDFYGKFILATNNESGFARIDREEVRFWVRKLKPIAEDEINLDVEAKMVEEIPAFLAYLSSRPAVIIRSRSVFTDEEIFTEWLEEVKNASMNSLYKEIRENFIALFDEYSVDEIHATAIDIKERWFDRKGYENFYIVDVLTRDFGLVSQGPRSYVPFNIANDAVIEKKKGRYYIFNRKDFVS